MVFRRNAFQAASHTLKHNPRIFHLQHRIAFKRIVAVKPFVQRHHFGGRGGDYVVNQRLVGGFQQQGDAFARVFVGYPIHAVFVFDGAGKFSAQAQHQLVKHIFGRGVFGDGIDGKAQLLFQIRTVFRLPPLFETAFGQFEHFKARIHALPVFQAA